MLLTLSFWNPKNIRASNSFARWKDRKQETERLVGRCIRRRVIYRGCLVDVCTGVERSVLSTRGRESDDAPSCAQPWPQSLRRLKHERLLATELDAAWAAEPLAPTRHQGRTDIP